MLLHVFHSIHVFTVCSCFGLQGKLVEGGLHERKRMVTMKGSPTEQLPRTIHQHHNGDRVIQGTTSIWKFLNLLELSAPEVYLEWVQCIDQVFECHEYTEVRKYKLAAHQFTDYANLWWANLKGTAKERQWRRDVKLVRDEESYVKAIHAWILQTRTLHQDAKSLTRSSIGWGLC